MRYRLAAVLVLAICRPCSSGAPAPHIDDDRTRAAGIRKVAGTRFTLYTDLPAGASVDGLVGVFDQAYPEWSSYFALSGRDKRPWHVTGYLMRDKARFHASGLLPDDLPPFLHGYTRDDELWWYEQPSEYFRRHLLLHEGTHSFMYAMFGGCGPPWYMEGLAELLATHTLVEGRLVLGYFPAGRGEVPLWGRIKIVRDAVAAGRRLSLAEVLAYGPRAHRQNEPYGWCWAAAAFLDGHPRYRERFRQLPADVGQPDFNRRFLDRFKSDWQELTEEWQLFTDSLEYGHDLARSAIDFRSGEPLPAGGRRANVAADRGWQASGVRLEAGKTYRLRAAGRYQVANRPRTWWCEPGGVSIRYYRGRPLGVLVAAVRPEPPDDQAPSALLEPVAIGLEATLTPSRSGTLYLRVNDSPAELADNARSLEVEIRTGPP